jgi:hypothetical protein
MDKVNTPSVKNIIKCAECNKRLNITNNIECKCKKILCYQHRYYNTHNCNYDFKTEERKKLSETLVKITHDKIIKI